MTAGKNLAVLGQRGNGLHGDSSVALRLCQDEHERCPRVPDDVERRSERPQVVRARPRRNQNEVSEPEELPVLFGQRWRRVDEAVGHSHLRQRVELRGQLTNVDGRQLGDVGLAGLPPGGEGLLWVRVDHDGRPVAGALGGDSEMGDHGRLPASALLTGNRDCLH